MWPFYESCHEVPWRFHPKASRYPRCTWIPPCAILSITCQNQSTRFHSLTEHAAVATKKICATGLLLCLPDRCERLPKASHACDLQSSSHFSWDHLGYTMLYIEECKIWNILELSQRWISPTQGTFQAAAYGIFLPNWPLQVVSYLQREALVQLNIFKVYALYKIIYILNLTHLHNSICSFDWKPSRSSRFSIRAKCHKIARDSIKARDVFGMAVLDLDAESVIGLSKVSLEKLGPKLLSHMCLFRLRQGDWISKQCNLW